MDIDRTWAKSHNIVAELNTDVIPVEFTEMANFLNATSLRYALTVNPTIYAAHIKQFWHSAKVKTLKGELCVRAFVDDQKVVVSEATIRTHLLFDDEEGTKCLARNELFEGLEELGYEKKDNGQKISKRSFLNSMEIFST